MTLTLLGKYCCYGIQTWQKGRLMHGVYTDGLFDDLDLDARSQWLGGGTNSALLNYLDN